MPSQEDEFGEILKQFQDANENDDADASAEAIGRVWEHLRDSPRTDSPWLAALGRAHECEARFDWKGAKVAYREAVVAGRADNLALQAKALGSLCALFNLLDEPDRALEVAVEAVAVARKVEKPWMRAHALKSALPSESVLRMRRGELEVARELLREEFELLREDEKMSEALVPGALVRRALLNIKSEDFEAAQLDLNEAWPLLQARREWTFMTTYQAGFANWWTAKALLCAAQNDCDGEIEARREAVEFRFVVAQAPQLEGPFKWNSLAKAWFDLAMALRPVDFAGSEEALDQSDMLRRNIGLEPFALPS